MTADLLNDTGVSGPRALVPFRGHQVRPRALPARDVLLEIPATSVDNILLYLQLRNMLNVNFTDPRFNTTLIESIFPSVYQQCPACPFSVGVVFPWAPVIVAGPDAASLQLVNSVFGLNIVKSGSAPIPFVDLFVNLTLSVTDLTVNTANKVYFQLGLEILSFGIDHSAIGPFVRDLISSLVTFLLEKIAIPDFNEKFQGIGLNQVIQDAVIDVEDGRLFFGFNLGI